MRKRATLTLLLLLPSALARAGAQERIRIAIGEMPPVIGAALPHRGVVPELIVEIFGAAGIAVDFDFVPWKRAYSQTQAGQVHATALWGRTPEREELFDFSDTVFTDELVLFYRREQPVVWDGKDTEALRGLTVGLPLGSAKAPLLAQAERSGAIRYEVSGDSELNLRKLLARRFEAVDLARSAGLALLQQHFSPAERARIAHTVSYQQWHYCMMFSRKTAGSARYLALFNAGLRKLKASGRFQQIWDGFQRELER